MKLRSIILAAFFLMAPQRADAEQPVPSFCFSTVEIVKGIPVSTAYKIPMKCWSIVKTDIAVASAAVPVCKMPGRVWHEGKCWKPERIPKP